MNHQLIEFRFSKPGKMGVLTSTVIFVQYTQYLQEKEKLDFVDEVNRMRTGLEHTVSESLTSHHFSIRSRTIYRFRCRSAS